MDGRGAAGDNLLVREERVQGADFHAQGLGFLAHQAAHIAVGLYAQPFAQELRPGGRGELGAGHENHQAQGEFRHGIGVLSRGVHDHDAPGGGGGEVHIVKSGAGAHHNLELGGGGHHFFRYFVRTDDEGFGICHGGDKVALLGIFFQFADLVTGGFQNIGNAFNRSGGKGLLGGK